MSNKKVIEVRGGLRQASWQLLLGIEKAVKEGYTFAEWENYSRREQPALFGHQLRAVLYKKGEKPEAPVTAASMREKVSAYEKSLEEVQADRELQLKLIKQADILLPALEGLSKKAELEKFAGDHGISLPEEAKTVPQVKTFLTEYLQDKLKK